MATDPCPRSLSGVHVYAQRGTRTGGWFKCVCGATADRRAYFQDQERRRVHKDVLRCGCRGTLVGCAVYRLQDRLQWQQMRVGIFEDVLSGLRWKLEDAMRDFRDAERRLAEEREHAAALAAELLIHQRASA